jgi:hypothetical protein
VNDHDPHVVHLPDAEARALHQAVENIAREERRAIGGFTIIAAILFGISGLVWAALDNEGMEAASAGALGIALAESLWLRFTRPQSVKAWKDRQ